MVSLVDVTGLTGPLRLIVQFDGLCCTGTLALLSAAANSAITQNLASVIFTLRDTEVDMGRGLRSAAFHGSETVVAALLAAGADKNAAMQIVNEAIVL